TGVSRYNGHADGRIDHITIKRLCGGLTTRSLAGESVNQINLSGTFVCCKSQLSRIDDLFSLSQYNGIRFRTINRVGGIIQYHYRKRTGVRIITQNRYNHRTYVYSDFKSDYTY